MEFSRDEVIALLRRSERYRQLRVRFRFWVIEQGTDKATLPPEG
jgi:hypothetical protein